MTTSRTNLPRRTGRFTAGLTAGALLVAACSGGGDGNSEPDADSAADEAASTLTTTAASEPRANEPSAVTEPTVAEPAVTEPAVPDAPDEPAGDGLTSATAAPIVGAQFPWTEGEAEWNITLEGFIETDRSSADDGRCAALFGTATLQSLPDGFWNSGQQQPKFGLRLGGEYVKPSNNGCDDEINAAQGYRYSNRLSVIAGTSFPFVAQFQLDEAVLADVEALVVGREDAELQRFFRPTAVDAVPAAVHIAGDLASLPVQPVDVISTSAPQGDHDVRVIGLTAIPATDLARADEGAGNCIAVITTMTATGLTDGLVTDAAPSIGVLADGQLLTSFGGDCDLDPISAAGYQTASGTSLTPGTSVDVVTAIFVPDELADAQVALAVGLLPRLDAQLFDFDLEPANDFPAPAAPADASTLPIAEGPMAPGPMAYAPREDDTAWTVDAAGVVDGGLSDDGLRQCWYAPMVVTPSADDVKHPQMYAISDGQAFSASTAQCSASVMIDAGWESLTRLDFTAETPQAGFETFSIPLDSAGRLQQFIIGIASTDQPVIVRDVTILDAVPVP